VDTAQGGLGDCRARGWALLFVVVAHIAWAPALLIAGGPLLGGQIGATLGRRLPPAVLHSLIVAVGLVAVPSW
jgi:uncharacterized protein